MGLLLFFAGVRFLPASGTTLPLLCFSAAFLAVAIPFALQSLRMHRLLKPAAKAAAPTSGAQADLHAALERLYREKQALSAQVDELTAVREVALAVGSILDFGEMIRAILELVTSHFSISKAIIYLRTQEEDWFEVVGARANDREIPIDRVLQKRIPLGVGLVGQAAMERRERIESRPEKGVIAAVPLLIQHRVVGVMKLWDPDPAALTPDRCRRLHAISGAIAVALENCRLYRMAVTDGLTGLYVHRHFQHRLEEEFTRSRRYDSPLSLLLVDIDHFKKFNDTYGHRTGDEVLRGVARLLQSCARCTDVVCRYGGEEMCLILPETDATGAAQIAERIRVKIEKHVFTGGNGEKLKVTVSIGVASFHEGLATRGALIERTDEALYRAKRAGRNRVESDAPKASAEVA
jgi:diguanylate cyclase (GGDEF)-like protein